MSKTIRGACIAAALVLAAVTAAGSALAATVSDPTASAAPQVLPSVFAGIAAASALLERLDSSPSQFPTSEPFYVDFAEGDSTYAAQTLYARAAPYYPGDTIAGLGALLCTAGASPACGLPGYPLMAVAGGQHTDASVGSQAGALALSGVAHADSRGVSTVSDVGGFDQAGSSGANAHIASLRRTMAGLVGHSVGASNSALHIGAMHSSTTQKFVGGTLVTTAESLDSDVSLLGGVIHIGSVAASSRSESDGAVVKHHTDNATISDVTVAGMAATIDDKGISVAGSGVVPASQIDAINAALQQGLDSGGISVHFIGHTPGQSVLQGRGCTAGEADGLQIHAARPINAPTVGALFYDDVAIGGACTTVYVGAPPVLKLPPLEILPGGGVVTNPSVSGAVPTGSTVGATSAPSSGGTSPGAQVTPGPVTSSGAQSPLASGPIGASRIPSLEAELATHVVAHRLTLLYAIFGLLSVAILLAAMPFVRPRLPRGNP